MKKFTVAIYIISFMATITILGVVIATSYAYVRITKTQAASNLITTSVCNSITFGAGQSANAINLTNQYPITVDEGYTKSPYTFTITNNCSTTSTANVNLEVQHGSTLPAGSIRAAINPSGEIQDRSGVLGVNFLSTIVSNETTVDGAYTLASYTLTPGQVVTLDLRLWIDEAATIANLGTSQTFKAKLVLNK